MVWVSTEVDVDLEDFSDDELVAELEERGYYVSKSASDSYSDSYSLQDLYDAWVYKTGDYEDLFRRYCQATIGRSF